VSFLRKLFGREVEVEDVPITLDVERRRTQLLRLEQALDALATGMRTERSTDDPGWRSRVNEYNRLAGQAQLERQRTPTRDSLLDLVFEVRPLFTGEIPPGMDAIGPLQDEVMAAAGDLRQLLPGEKG
jgi:hypothetical protein